MNTDKYINRKPAFWLGAVMCRFFKVHYRLKSGSCKWRCISTYDDDIYKIDTTNFNNKWYNDPNFDLEYKRIITFEKIPLNSIKLIYKGTGSDTL